MAITIRRAPRDKDHPWAIIPKSFIEDFSISLQAKALLLYCFSRKDDWTFYVTQLAKIHKIGYRKALSLLNEGETAGYVQRRDIFKGNIKQGCEYLFDEYKQFSNNVTDMHKTCTSETIVENDKIAETKHTDSNNVTDVSCFRHAENDNLVSNDSVVNTEEIHKKSPPSSAVSADADVLTHFLIQSIKRRDTGFKEPNIAKWCVEMDRLLRIDLRPKEEASRLISWTEGHSYWRGAILSPANLRKNYSNIKIQYEADQEKILIRENRNLALKTKELHPEKLKHLSFDDKFVRNVSLGKEVPFNLNPESFKTAFASLFGGKYERRV